MKRRCVGVAPELLNTILLVRCRSSRLGEDVVDHLRGRSRGKTVISADAHAQFDLERAAGSNGFLPSLRLVTIKVRAASIRTAA